MAAAAIDSHVEALRGALLAQHVETNGTVPHDAVVLKDLALELKHDHFVAAAQLG